MDIQMSTTATTPLILKDPMLETYGLYEENGRIQFETAPTGYGWRRRRTAYTYYIAKKELWRVYVRDKRNMRRIPSWHQPQAYARTHHLTPIWPKHMRMDQGL